MNIFSRIKTGNERYPALTGIRALGATAVFFAHLPFAMGFPLAVDVLAFFFVLSGFLIVYLYYQDPGVVSGRYYNYFVNRVARIYPVYFLLVTLAILYTHNFQPGFLIKNYTLTHALFQHSKRAIDPSWSLTVEECFYFLSPLLMLLIRRFSFFISFMFAVFLLMIALLISSIHITFLHTADFVLSTTFFGHFLEFYAGAFLALLILKREKRGIPAVRGSKWTVGGIIGIILSMSVIVTVQFMDSPLKRTLYIAINNFILPLPIAVLYFGLITEHTFLSRLLSGKLLGLLGRTSYSFYLVHMLVIDCIAVPYLLPYFTDSYNLYVMVVFILTQLIALLIFVFYEEPLNLFIRKKFRKKEKVAGVKK
jgi:peptidoglycan/LPS O-acetylase OafA/YrhL